MITEFTGVEPRHLATLAAIDELGSFKGAAERLGYVPSAASQQIAQLERLLRVPLVNRIRGQHGVEVTQAGAVLADHGRAILAQLEAALCDLRVTQATTREIHIGVNDRAVMSAMLFARELMRTRDPALRIIVRDDLTAEERADHLRRGALDAVIDDLPFDGGELTTWEIVRDPIVLVVHRDSPLAHLAVATLEDLSGVPLVTDASWRMQDLIVSQMRAAGMQPRFILDAGLTASVQALASGGLSAALMPRLSVNDRDPNIAIVGLGDMLPPRRVGMVWCAHRRRISDLEAFRDALLQACDQTIAPPPAVDHVVELPVAA